MGNPYPEKFTYLGYRYRSTTDIISRREAWDEGHAAAKAEQAEIVSELVEALTDCAADSMAAGLGTGDAGANGRWNAAVSAIAKATGI